MPDGDYLRSAVDYAISAAGKPPTRWTSEERAAIEYFRQTQISPEERDQQAISFIWGNISIENPTFTREEAEEIYRKVRSETKI